MDTKSIRPEEKKIRVICVRTGNKFDQWYEDNFKYMIDKHSGLKYDEFVVIRDNVYEDDYGCFNKLLMFDRYREEHYRNIYFDIDVIIKGDCNKFLTDELHVCDSRSWQSDDYYKNHLQISSDILSWSGDYSHIQSKVADNLDYYYVKYHNGIDKYLGLPFYIFDKSHQKVRYDGSFCTMNTLLYSALINHKEFRYGYSIIYQHT